ncbi:unnamed protein product [Vitrella brassicaformis CCMP3155]|uniref:Uncharacterized protein n=1 Tax=Vitrella brassicaformis (strain CCMP3155) TaxID=1169540 RepID=A0A0G4EUK6_VITBC|nr:unnamed protein product [Vitrella brassicaformis CCMP3155]|eukprot:CEM01990.1 unnamed protein product [Vitrella brassicaformis CCMP3155]
MLTASEHMWVEQNRLLSLVRKYVPFMRKVDELDFCRLLKYVSYMLTIVDYMSDLAVGMGMVQRGIALWPGVCILLLCQVDTISAAISYGIRTKATLRQNASLFAASLFELPILILTILYGANSTDIRTIVISITATSSTIAIKGVATLHSVITERLRKRIDSTVSKTSTTRETMSTEGPTNQDGTSCPSGQPAPADPTNASEMAGQEAQGGNEGPVQQQYVRPKLGGAHVINMQVQLEDDVTADHSMLSCAKISCILSIFFPIIGCITFCLNLDAKKGSERHKWARRCLYTALAVLTLVIILRVIILSLWLSGV